MCPLTPRAFVDAAREVGLTDAEIDEKLAGGKPSKSNALELARLWCRANEEAEDYATVETIARSSEWLVEIEKDVFGAYIPDE